MQIPGKFYHIIYTLFYFFLLLLPLFHFFKHSYITTKWSSCIKKSMQPESENNLRKVSWPVYIPLAVEQSKLIWRPKSFINQVSFRFCRIKLKEISEMLILWLFPTRSCCPSCKDYYRQVLTFVPGGVAVVAFIALLSLLPYKIGLRANTGMNSICMKLLLNIFFLNDL